eukprot:jgi/Psemu1/42807/gm1.42807_g
MAAANKETTTASCDTKVNTLLCLITGPSGSGKTSIALGLQKRLLSPDPRNKTESIFDATVIHQDRYFTKPFIPYQDRTDDSYETGSGIDWSRLLADIESLAAADATTTSTTSTGAATTKQQPTKIIIVDGHVLGDAASLLRQRFFGGTGNAARPDSVLAVPLVGCSLQTCKKRRIGRNPDRSEDEATALAAYYDAHVWPSYRTHGVRAVDAVKRELELVPGGFLLEIDNSESASLPANIETITETIRGIHSTANGTNERSMRRGWPDGKLDALGETSTRTSVVRFKFATVTNESVTMGAEEHKGTEKKTSQLSLRDRCHGDSCGRDSSYESLRVFSSSSTVDSFVTASDETHHCIQSQEEKFSGDICYC